MDKVSNSTKTILVVSHLIPFASERARFRSVSCGNPGLLLAALLRRTRSAKFKRSSGSKFINLSVEEISDNANCLSDGVVDGSFHKMIKKRGGKRKSHRDTYLSSDFELNSDSRPTVGANTAVLACKSFQIRKIHTAMSANNLFAL